MRETVLGETPDFAATMLSVALMGLAVDSVVFDCVMATVISYQMLNYEIDFI
jgi:hypothetical protein